MNRAASERHAEILRRLRASGFVGAAGLAREFGVSEMTVRRDLQAIAEEGLGRRVHGGLGLPDGVLAGSGIELGLPFEARSEERAEAKRRLADLTAGLLGELGQGLVALDAGTTIAPLAALLPAGRSVVSHSVPVIITCSRRDDLTLVGLGGDYQPQTRSFGGPATRAAIADLAIAVAVLSATAISAAGTWSTNSADAETKCSLAAAADTVVLVVDGSKLGGRGSVRALDLHSVDLLVTEAPVDPATADWLTAAGIRVITADC